MNNIAALIAVAILGLAAVLGCGRLTERSTNEEPRVLNEKSNSFSLIGKEWRSFDLDGMDITVDLPGPPIDKTPAPSQFPPGYKEVFDSMRVHAYDEKDFGSSYTQLVPTGKRKFQIKELADTSMAALRRQARDLTYTLDITSETKAKYNGTFTRNGKKFELKGCCIYQKTNPLRVWAIITLYPENSADGRTASQRIIDSAVFRGSTEKCN